MKPTLTTEYLLKAKPAKWQEYYGEYARLGLILDNYSIEEKIKYLIDNAYYKTSLNAYLEKQITEFIINMERNAKRN